MMIFDNFTKRRRIRAEIKKTIDEVTRNLPTEFISSDFAGVANEIASPAPYRLTDGRRYTGDTISFIAPYRNKSLMCFISKNKNFLIWSHRKKWYYRDNMGVEIVLSKKQAVAATELVDKAKSLVSSDFNTHSKLYFELKQKRKKLNLEKLHRTKRRVRRLDPELA